MPLTNELGQVLMITELFYTGSTDRSNALTYAELDFPRTKQQRTKKRAKKKANRSHYASIDHTKVGTPLPESSYSEEDIFDYLPEGYLGNQDDEDNDTIDM